MITNELVEPYKTTLKIDDYNKAQFECAESNLLNQATRETLYERTELLAQSVCTSDYSLTKFKAKTLTINPGEYYSELSAKVSCVDKISPQFDLNAKKLCRLLFGPSYRAPQLPRYK